MVHPRHTHTHITGLVASLELWRGTQVEKDWPLCLLVRLTPFEPHTQFNWYEHVH